MRKGILLAVILLLGGMLTACGNKVAAPEVDLAAHEAIDLWTEEVPFSEQGDSPEILPYMVDSQEPTACMIVCPGGAYEQLATDSEGIAPAEALNEKGISAFVLNYRISPATHEAIMEDVLRAVRFVRYHAEYFNIDPERIGVMGFSAGGHLALMSLEHFDVEITKIDDIDKESSKPTLGVLCYPVVSFNEEITHEKTKNNFLGNDVDKEELTEKYSGEESVREDMPPFFVWHSKKDTAAPVEGTLKLVENAKAVGVHCRDLIYEYGKHGVGMAENMNIIDGWFEECTDWLRTYNFCK